MKLRNRTIIEMMELTVNKVQLMNGSLILAEAKYKIEGDKLYITGLRDIRYKPHAAWIEGYLEDTFPNLTIVSDY